MEAARNPGRVAGLWYLVIIVVGPLRLMYIPAKLYVSGDATATANNLIAHEPLFRLGMASDMLCALALVILVMAFYKLFEGVSRYQAVLLAIFGGVMPATMYLINVALDAAALTAAANAGNVLSAFDTPQRNAIAMLLLRIHDHVMTASLVLAGAWPFPMAILFYRSQFMPRLIAIWLFMAGCCWTAIAFTGFLAPQYRGREFSWFQPFFFAEIALTLWLLIRGARAGYPELPVALKSD